MAEQAFLAEPIPSAGGKVIASPFQFYTTGEDRLRIVSANSLTGVTIAIHSRFLGLDGTILANAWTHTPNADRTLVTTDFELGAGAILNLTVFAGAGSPKIGQTFVIVQLVRGVGTAAIVLGTLLQGYVTGTQQLAWPGSPIQDSISGGGYIRSIVGTKPAKNASVTESVPTGARWELLAVRCEFDPDATDTQRDLVLQMTAPGIGSVAFLVNGQTAVADDTGDVFSWAQGAQNTKTTVGQFIGSGAAPMRYVLQAGDNFTIFRTNAGPNDQFQAPIYTVREWLEVQ